MANPTGAKRISLSALTVNEATASERIGTIRTVVDSVDGEKTYIYVRAKTTLLVGYVCGRLSSASGQITGRVTPDISTGVMKYGKANPIGIAVGTISTSNYGWLQRTGVNRHTKSSGNVGAGSILTWTLDMRCVSASLSIAANMSFGHSLAADSGSIVTRCHLACRG